MLTGWSSTVARKFCGGSHNQRKGIGVSTLLYGDGNQIPVINDTPLYELWDIVLTSSRLSIVTEIVGYSRNDPHPFLVPSSQKHPSVKPRGYGDTLKLWVSWS